MTLVGYFNSMRELGGMRRLVDDDVRLAPAEEWTSAAWRERQPPDHWKN